MNKGKYVFSQLLDFLDRNDFNYLARKYGGDKYVKQFTDTVSKSVSELR